MSRPIQLLGGFALALGCGLILCPTARAADYTLPVSSFAESGGGSSSQRYQLTYVVGQPSPVGSAGNLEYGLLNGLAALISDVVPPAITMHPTERARRGAAIEISADIADAQSGVDSVALIFRAGGAATFSAVPMVVGDIGFAGTIPARFVTERGLAYYVEARDHNGNRSYFPRGAPDSLKNLPVYLSDLTSDFEVPSGKYRMISLPAMPTDGSADSVLADDFGAYGKKSWRLGRWNTSRPGCGEQCYDEYPAIDSLMPGRAFWIISSTARAFDFSGATSDISRPFACRLSKGWNQIGTPFGFDTDWLSAGIRFEDQVYAIGQVRVVGSDTILVDSDLVGYEPSSGTYAHSQSQLHPWAGYWIYNGSTQPVDLILDPGSGASPPTSAARATDGAGLPELGRGATPGDFLAAVRLKSEGSSGQAAVAGLSPSAGDAWDAFDLREPPPVGDYARMVFRHSDWGRHSGAYVSDIKRAGDDGAYWELLAETSERRQPLLDLELTRIPQGWQVYLYDLEEGVRFDQESLPHAFDVEGSRRFALIAGTEEFIATQEISAGIDLKTRIISVTPNPFAQSIKVTFFVPEKQPVKLQIFSVEGRLVGAIDEPEIARGVHSLAWDGRSLRGQPAAPGVYFIRLETSRAEFTRKVLKLR